MKRLGRAVVKISGKLVEDDDLLAELAASLKELRGWSVVLVHGGGPAIGHFLEKLGVHSAFAAGQRVTDASTLEVVEMVLSGKVNKKIVGLLNHYGVEALGISGRDANWLRARPSRSANGKLGLVGDIQQVRLEVLRHLTRTGYMPVVSPVSSGPGGQAYNVNADWAAAKIASAWRSDFLLYFGDTPGVLRGGVSIPRLNCAQAVALIRQGQVDGGMIPKLESAMWSLRHGVGKVRILRWDGPQTLSRAMRRDEVIGTLIESCARG